MDTDSSSSTSLGASVSDAGDVNADGYDDVIVGSPNYQIEGGNWLIFAGRVQVFSNLDGLVIHTFHGGYNERLGEAVSAAGDVNGDGYDDLIIGVPAADSDNSSGSARVYSGLDGSLVFTFNGNEEQYEDTSGDYFGTSVGGAGDINGDGYADLIVGAPGDDNAADESGSAQVFLGGGQSGVAGFSGGILTIPVLQVAATFYRLDLELVNSEPIEFELSSLSVLTNPDTENMATFADDVIIIPLLLYQGVYYRLELSVYSMVPEVILRVAGVEAIL